MVSQLFSAPFDFPSIITPYYFVITLFFQPLVFTSESIDTATELGDLIDGYCMILSGAPNSLIMKRAGMDHLEINASKYLIFSVS